MPPPRPPSPAPPALVDAAIRAYRRGAFPMAEDGELGFYTCDPRSVFLPGSFHAPRRLLRTWRNNPFEMRLDTAFEAVVRGCRTDRPEWISEELVQLYLELFRRGHAHSVEAWRDGELAGGLYGTRFGAAFLAESMFHRQEHASNLCLLHLMEHLRAGGFHFCDIQYANPHTARFHPVDLPQRDFLRLLQRALAATARW